MTEVKKDGANAAENQVKSSTRKTKSQTNLYQRMSAITEEIGVVAKNLTVGENRNAYKAVSEADVLAAVKPIEVKHGVYSYPHERKIIETAVFKTEKEYHGNKYTTEQKFLRVETIYRFINVDSPNEYIDIKTYGDGVDPQDKAVGKAMTYADKYALLKAYKIQTGEDPDAQKSEEGKWEKEDKEIREQMERQKTKMATEEDIQKLDVVAKEAGMSLEEVLRAFNLSNTAEMTQEICYRSIGRLNEIRLENEEKARKDVATVEE